MGSNNPAEGFTIRLFGACEVSSAPGAGPVRLTSRLRDLLAILVAEPGRPRTRESLVEELWPEADGECSRGCLRTALARLRRIGPCSDGCFLRAGSDGYVSIADHAAASVDAIVFDRLTDLGDRKDAAAAMDPAVAEHVEAALAIYRGEFGCGSYNDTVIMERERHRERFIALNAFLALYHDAHRAHDRALGFCRAVLREDPLREAVHQRVLLIYLASGRRAEAVAHYRRLADRLRAELDVAPLPETTALAEAAVAADAAATPPPLAAAVGDPPPLADALRAALKEVRGLIRQAERLERRIERQIDRLG